jgi:hypothetical protein
VRGAVLGAGNWAQNRCAILLSEFCAAKFRAVNPLTSGKPEVLAAQGIGGARSGRASGGTPAKPGFLRLGRKKCAQMKF